MITKWSARLNIPLWLQLFSKAMKRRSILRFMGLFAGSLCLSFALAACSSGNSASTPTPVAANTATPSSAVVRIGYQKSATLLNTLKSQGNFRKTFTTPGDNSSMVRIFGWPSNFRRFKCRTN
ncbi:MAG: hypothetical protein RSE13_00775 [Planktothrix sp. GU0601_MAG3]|nr:MAG: hypothetical protein RSE13_00775 [Planktothrix sp. GU0601_MAG3]